MTSDWRETTIGEQVTLQRGFDITKAEQRPGRIPVVSSGGVSSYHDTSMAKGPGVVLGRKGVVGSVYYIPGDYWPHDTSLWVRDFHGNDPRFVYYFFRSLAPQLAALDVGSANPTLNRNHVHPIRIHWPSVGLQQQIAGTLSLLDERIVLLRQTNATLESIAQALFKSWFIDFDPVRTKAEGREPEGLNAETAALFPAEFEESALGLIPKGWRATRLGDVFHITMGQSPPGETYNQAGDGTPFFQGRADFGFRFPSVRVYCTSPTRLARESSVLVSVRAPVGDVNVALEACAVGRGVAAVGFDSSPSFALYSMKALRERFAEYESHGTVFGSINKKQFEALPCVLPDASVLAAFTDAVGPLDGRLRENELQVRTLSEVRDTLLPRLISGKLRLPEAQEQAEDALA